MAFDSRYSDTLTVARLRSRALQPVGINRVGVYSFARFERHEESDRPSSTRRANIYFATITLVPSVLLACAVCLPGLCRYVLSTSFAGRIIALLTDPGVDTIAIALTICALVCYALTFSIRQFRMARSVALIAVLSVNATVGYASRRIEHAADVKELEAGWSNLKHLQIFEHPGIRTTGRHPSGMIATAALDTFADFHRYANDEYQAHATYLKENWAFSSDTERKLLFFMNFTSGLWAYGNKVHVSEPASALDNESSHWSKAPSLQAYLASEIGCCTDYAYILKSLLDHEGIQNRLTAIPGHIFNEIYLRNHWCILDATTNMFVDTSWEELYAKPELLRDSLTVHIFRHPGTSDQNLDRYRSIVGQFRLEMLTRFASRPAVLKQADHPALPAYFNN